MKKKLSSMLAFLLVAILCFSLLGCGKKDAPETNAPETANNDIPASYPVADENGYHFNADAFPVLDGSTSMVPLGQAITSVLLGISREEAADMLSFNKTTQSFYNLMYGDCDIVIAAEPDEDVFEMMDENNFNCDIQTIAYEGLVFVVNADNPVNNLTKEQVRDIYAGKITNWKEVGGNDVEIAAFQRNKGAGSQVMMEKLVMDGTPLMDAPEEFMYSSMEGLITGVKSYDNSANAIGYTVYYYANDMDMANGMKILSIDGITPTAETIRDQEYAFINGYYSAIASDTPEGSDARKLYNWLMSDIGQYLLRLEGYASVYGPDAEVEQGENIYFDFSKYVPYNSPVAKYTRISDDPITELKPSKNYGTILPYKVGNSYGFFNAKGELITDPVYASIERMTTDGLQVNDYVPIEPADYWVFVKGEYDSVNDEYPTPHMGFVSLDGSFVSDTDYKSIYLVNDRIFCAKDLMATQFDIFDLNHNLVATEKDLDSDFAGCSYYIEYAYPDRYIAHIYGDNYPYDDNWNTWLLDENFKPINGPYYGLSSYGNECLVAYDDDWNAFLIDREGNTRAFAGQYFFKNVTCYAGHEWYFVETFDGDAFVARSDGNPLYYVQGEGWSLGSLNSEFAILSNYETNEQVYLDAEGNARYEEYLTYGFESVGLPDIFYKNVEGGSVIVNAITGKEITIDNAYSCSSGNGGKPVIFAYSTDPVTDLEYTTIISPDLSNTKQLDGWVYFRKDGISGKEYIYQSIYKGGYNSITYLLDKNTYEPVFSSANYFDVQNDLVFYDNDLGFTAYDLSGNIVFCYPVFGSVVGD